MAGQAAFLSAAVLRQPVAPLRRGDRAAHGPAPGQLPAGVHPSGADQRGGTRDPRRGGIRRLGDVPARQRPHVIRRRARTRAAAAETFTLHGNSLDTMSGAMRTATRTVALVCVTIAWLAGCGRSVDTTATSTTTSTTPH